jgi:hypothetical protein
LRGFAFAYNISPYSDEFYFKSDACGEWKIPISLWKNYVDREKIQEITKEDFFSTFKKAKEEKVSIHNYCLTEFIE